eukprot:TRINITY_DN13005_c0_g1_i1.p2 TRINITY_DN13005_c0_g1~~TRINITY_DN13005_c0_g1_i1.p2  ORF type:complete len:193 (-),score=92.54 TRINITY_DN13005_c0_g1_i1:112-651(-)
MIANTTAKVAVPALRSSAVVLTSVRTFAAGGEFFHFGNSPIPEQNDVFAYTKYQVAPYKRVSQLLREGNVPTTVLLKLREEGFDPCPKGYQALFSWYLDNFDFVNISDMNHYVHPDVNIAEIVHATWEKRRVATSPNLSPFSRFKKFLNVDPLTGKQVVASADDFKAELIKSAEKYRSL